VSQSFGAFITARAGRRRKALVEVATLRITDAGRKALAESKR
jgi:hypothetical protein